MSVVLETRTSLDADEIRRLLPHRWPMLFLDRVVEARVPEFAAGTKNVTVAEPAFAGHFPNQSVLPGIYLIESLAQLAGVLIALTAIAGDDPSLAGLGYLAGVKRFQFRRPARPGDQLRLSVSRTAAAHGVAEFRGEVMADGHRVADGLLTVALVPDPVPSKES